MAIIYIIYMAISCPSCFPIVLGVLHYKSLLLYAINSCFPAVGLRHVYSGDQGPWVSFSWCFSESVERSL